jgi:hypothetical protein
VDVAQVSEPVRNDAADETADSPDVPGVADAATTSPTKPSWQTFWKTSRKTSTQPASTPEPEIEPAIEAEPEPAPPQALTVTEAAVLPAPTFEPAPEPGSAPPAATAAPAASAPVIEFPESAVVPEAEPQPAAEPASEHPEPFFTLAPPPPRRWPWLVGSLLALLALALQMSIAFRVELATWLPQTRPALITLCDLAGCEVGLPAKAELIGIEASDLHPDPQHAELLEVSATLKNRAPFAQTWPHLELTLTDTADKAIARKVLAPAEYLPAPTSKTALAAGMPANGEAAVSFIIATDGLTASGYRLYLFYP